MTSERVPAVGGTRTVPEPDEIARDYLLLALRLDHHLPGTVDGFYGPAALKAQVDMEPIRPAARLADDATSLRTRLAGEVADPNRRAWLDLQVVALETLARVAAGDSIPYLEQVERCLAIRPEPRSDQLFREAGDTLDALLPGPGTVRERLDELDAAWTVPPDRVASVVDALVGRFRERARALFGLPDGEALRVSLVRDQPWSGYNWYDGGLRSRVDINLDLPVRLPELVHTVAHETYPGHHLEHAEKERVLVEEQGHMEASLLAINAPECLISEGLAEAGVMFAAPPDELPDLLVEVATVAGVPLAADPVALRAAAGRQPAVNAAGSVINEARVNAALRVHVDGEPVDVVRDWMVSIGFSPESAAKRLEFITHPLWRLYVFVYPEGEALVRRWLLGAPPAERPARSARLLREPLTPPRLRAETPAL